jgi:uncharacterized membrane protein YeaQ/YmgE (transglycosylase-associated protein family)
LGAVALAMVAARGLPRPARVVLEGNVSILFFVILGLIAGLLARAIMPGRQPMGIVATTLLGMAGSLFGGFVASLFTHRPILEFHTSGIIGSVLGALALLFAMVYVGRHRHTTAHA